MSKAAPVKITYADGSTRTVRASEITMTPKQRARQARQKAMARGDNKSSYPLEILAWGAGYKGYQAFLRSAYWRKLRAEVLARDGSCSCGATVGLQVHHLTYVRFGKELLEDLKAKCDACHRKIHGRAR